MIGITSRPGQSPAGRQNRWRSSQAWTGNLGGHSGGYQPEFLHSCGLPIFHAPPYKRFPVQGESASLPDGFSGGKHRLPPQISFSFDLTVSGSATLPLGQHTHGALAGGTELFPAHGQSLDPIPAGGAAANLTPRAFLSMGCKKKSAKPPDFCLTTGGWGG
jgi:hypothetical protein